ncbi:hypothetical protein NL676_036985 [Syzygium grande]|nr:hypothetical protein NL676_036985 [Syzygium grande]
MSILAQLSDFPLVSLLLYAISSSTPAILDHEVLENDHNEYEVTFKGHTIYTHLTYSSSVTSSWLLSHSSEHLIVGLSRGFEHLVVGLDIEWLAGLEGVYNLAAIL